MGFLHSQPWPRPVGANVAAVGVHTCGHREDVGSDSERNVKTVGVSSRGGIFWLQFSQASFWQLCSG